MWSDVLRIVVMVLYTGVLAIAALSLITLPLLLISSLVGRGRERRAQRGVES